MIKITLLSGPYAGEMREIASHINPEKMISSFLQHDWEWSIDYSHATEKEIFFWMRQDLAARCIRAIKSGRQVSFLDKIFKAVNPSDPAETERLVAELEDAIVYSGRLVTIESDDNEGVVIGVRGYEQ